MPVNGINPQAQQFQTQSSSSLGSLDKDAFLKLLVAQLKYQNPLSPSDPSQFMAQTAQFTMVEKIEQLTATFESSLATERGTMAASMIGRNVKTHLYDQDISGVVTRVSFSDPTGPMLFLDHDDTKAIPFIAIQEIS